MREIKKVFILLLTLLLLASSLMACSRNVATPVNEDVDVAATDDSPGAGAEKVAILLAGVKDDYGYNYACYGLAQEIEK